MANLDTVFGRMFTDPKTEDGVCSKLVEHLSFYFISCRSRSYQHYLMMCTPICVWQSSLVAPDELLYFADVCAGPGGFSEYVLWRRHQQVAAAISRLSSSSSSSSSTSSSKPEPKSEPKPDVYASLNVCVDRLQRYTPIEEF